MTLLLEFWFFPTSSVTHLLMSCLVQSSHRSSRSMHGPGFLLLPLLFFTNGTSTSGQRPHVRGQLLIMKSRYLLQAS